MIGIGTQMKTLCPCQVCLSSNFLVFFPSSKQFFLNLFVIRSWHKRCWNLQIRDWFALAFDKCIVYAFYKREHSSFQRFLDEFKKTFNCSAVSTRFFKLLNSLINIDLFSFVIEWLGLTDILAFSTFPSSPSSAIFQLRLKNGMLLISFHQQWIERFPNNFEPCKQWADYCWWL